MAIADCSLVDLPRIADPRGNLTFVEGRHHLPFDLNRIFYLYDVPGGSSRAGHALKQCHQLIIAISGSFDVVLDDGFATKSFSLNRSYYGLHVTPLTWRVLDNFSSNSVCLVLASERYSETDYYREYDAFLAAARQKGVEGP